MNTSVRNADVKADRTHEKRLIIGAVCLAGLSMPLSFTGPALALPAISVALGGSPFELAWVTNAFMLAFGSCLLLAGTLADRYGRKRVFLAGVLSFALSSIFAALASSLLAVDVARALQGVAGAAALSAGAAALAQEFDGEARTRAFGLLGTAFGVGLALGPVIAGALIAHFGWRSVFAITTMITSMAFAFGLKCMRETRDPFAQNIDWPGAATFTCALGLFTYVVLRAPYIGWASARVLVGLSASALIAMAFVVIELRSRRPMLELTLLRYPRFVGVQFLAAAPAYSYVVLLVLMPSRLIGIEGFDSVATGRMMFALSAPMLVVPPFAARLARSLAPGIIAGLGLLLCACGQIWLAQCAPGQPVGHLLMAMLVIGVGVGLPWGLMDGLAVSVVPKERAGMAAGIFNTTRVAGECIALAIVAALLAAFTQANLRGASLAGANDAALEHAANRLAMGNVSAAAAWIPSATNGELIRLYGAAFHSLLYVLAGVTVLSAVLVLSFLGRATAHDDYARKNSSMSACN